ncbi:hypothetical protein Nepgr_007441 [Nepenthes gracilis]|uniref:Uncharacterized protein n=1 Tax=Nepenthes gracilis TaxID=150966 RepID=A0AAD3S7M7_NEPGR|nr:hypothetical protein Nepgr_007441 [Nepenthes gracilis]
MVLEEQNQMSSNSSSGGGGGSSRGDGGNRSSKKMKQKKIPRRGLGVAQLEIIRIRDQQQNDAENGILSSSPTISPTNSSVPLPFLNYTHNQISSPIPYHLPSPNNLQSPNSVFRPVPSLPNINNFQSSSFLPLNLANGGHFDVGGPSIAVPANVNFPKMWRPNEFNREWENSKLDHGFPFRANINLPYESSPIGPLHHLQPRTPYRQPSSLVNASSTNSSSLLNFQMEPPSNQSYYSTHRSPWSEEHKMVGMKRPYPFPLDNPPASSFIGKSPPVSNLVRGCDESASCGNESTLNMSNAFPYFREAPPFPRGIPEPKSTNICSENGITSGELLTLAPPASVSPYPSPRFKHHSSNVPSHNEQLYSFESLTHQQTAENPVVDSWPGGSNQLPFYRFFPASKVEAITATTDATNRNGGGGESVDLNLKL